MKSMHPLQNGGRELSGRTVLICLVAFFGIVAGANGLMVYFATSTFGGVETESAYKAGLAYKAEAAAARAQAERNWQVDAQISRNRDGDALLTVQVNDSNGAPVAGLDILATLAHPLNKALDHDVVLRQDRTGFFRGAAPAGAGQWTLMIDVMRNDERVFRSRSRVVLR